MRPSPPARQGIRDGLTLVVAYIPFAVALGAALASTDVAPVTAWSSSALVFAGAAQLVAVEMLGAGAGAAVVVATALVVNARHLLYSASMGPYVAGWPRRDRWLAAYFLADPVFALAVARLETVAGDGASPDVREHRDYYAGMAVTCWVGWLALTGTGAMVADVLPAGPWLDAAAPLTFLLLLLPLLRLPASWAAAGVGGGAAVLASGLPLGLVLLVGSVAGVAAGTATAGAGRRRAAGGAGDA